MNYRCPICHVDAGLQKFAHAVVARMETDCPHCLQRIRLNVHPLETRFAVIGLAAFIALGSLAYWLQNQDLLMLALLAGITGAAATPVLGRTILRDWPRYAPGEKRVRQK